MTGAYRTHPIRIIPSAHTAAEDEQEKSTSRSSDAGSRFRRLLASQAAARSAGMSRLDGGVEMGGDLGDVAGRSDEVDTPETSDTSDTSGASDSSERCVKISAHDDVLDDTQDEDTASPLPRRVRMSGGSKPMRLNTFEPALAERLARDLAIHCEAADAVPDGHYEITIRIEPSVLPDTSLTLSASGSDLSLRFQSGAPRSVALLSVHADALQSRLIRRTYRRVSVRIVSGVA